MCHCLFFRCVVVITLSVRLCAGADLKAIPRSHSPWPARFKWSEYLNQRERANTSRISRILSPRLQLRAYRIIMDINNMTPDNSVYSSGTQTPWISNGNYL